MPLTDIIGAAALLGILVLAILVGYLISVVKRITSDLSSLRQLTSTADQAVAGNLRMELGQMSQALLAAVGGSTRELKEEHAQLADSIELTRSNLLAALQDQGSSMRELANSLHESTISRLAQDQEGLAARLRELLDRLAELSRSLDTTQSGLTTAVKDHGHELSELANSLHQSTISKLAQDQEGLAAKLRELLDKLAELSSSLELTQSGLSTAVQDHGRELAELAKSLHQSAISRLVQHETYMSYALRELRAEQGATTDAPATELAAESMFEAAPDPGPEAAGPADPGAALAAPPDAAAATDVSAAAPQAAADVSPEQASVAAATEGAVVTPPGITLRWEDLPAVVRARWHPRITEMILPPVTYDTQHDKASPLQLIAKVKHDPLLCAKILTVANSAAQGQIKPVTSIERAAVQLGANILQIIITAYHMEAIFGRYSSYSRQHFKFVRRWSCGSSVLAFHIALKAAAADHEMLSTAAMIARLGGFLLGMAEIGPDRKYREIPFETLRGVFEMEHWKVSTPLLSEQLVLHWGLPEPLPILLRLQETPMFTELSASIEDRQLLVICAAEVLAAAFISRGGEMLLQVLDDPHYAMLKRNIETHLSSQLISDVWASKAMQREFMTIAEMTG